MKILSGIVLALGAAISAVAIGLAASSFAQADHLRSGAGAVQLAEGNRQSTCLAQRQACISAGTQTGTYGQRYVPPEVVRQCYDGYRACIGQR